MMNDQIADLRERERICWLMASVFLDNRDAHGCHDMGVAVLWLPFDHSYQPRHILQNTDGVVLEGDMNPATAATEIGKAAAQALTKVTARTAA